MATQLDASPGRASLRRPSLLVSSVPSVLRQQSALPAGIMLGVASKRVTGFYLSSNGFEEESQGQILTYAPAVLRKNPFYLSCGRVRELTLFGDRHTWMVNVVRLLYSLTFALVLTYVQSLHTFAQRSRDVWMNANSEFRTVTAFVLGGFVIQSVSSWNRRRTNYASLCGSARNLLVLLAATIAREEVEARRDTGRWVSLALELAVLKPRGAIDTPAGREHLLRNGLVNAGEWDAMVHGDRHTSVLCWILSTVTELARVGKISEVGRSDIAGGVSAMRAQANDLMSSLDRDLPFPYASIMSVIIHLVLFIQATFTAFACSDSRTGHVETDADGSPRPVWYMWCFQLGCFFVLAMLYDSLLNVQHTLHNPFGSRTIDVAHDTIASGIRRLGTALMEGTSHAPGAAGGPTGGAGGAKDVQV